MFNYNNYLNDGSTNNNFNIVSPMVAYDRGNLWGNLYEPYKNYKVNELKASNDRERLFLELSRNAFAAHELNLYLDLHPDNASMIALFNDYRKKANQLTREYEAKYGPLNVSSEAMDSTPFAWVNNNMWPWEDRFNV